MDDLARCLEGDPEARDRFVDRFASVIHAAVRRVVRARLWGSPSNGVEDIVQDVFLRLFERDARLLRSYDPARASLRTWLAVISRSVAFDSLRKKRLPAVPPDVADRAPAPDERPRPQHPLGQAPADLLSPRQRLVMQLFYDRGLDVRDIARVLGIAEQTVRSARHKALRKLRAFFADGEDIQKSGDVR